MAPTEGADGEVLLTENPCEIIDGDPPGFTTAHIDSVRTHERDSANRDFSLQSDFSQQSFPPTTNVVAPGNPVVVLRANSRAFWR